jgi:tetratricopeptide (TPR) repeat protein
MSPNGSAEMLLREAETAAERGRWQEVRRILSPAREEIRLVPRGLLLLADACCRLDDLALAQSAAEEALAVFRDSADEEGAMKAQNLLGVALFHAGNLDAARVWFRSALARAAALGARRMRADIANNLGTICDLSGERDQALHYYFQALRLYEEIGAVQRQAQTSHNLGIAHRDQGQWEVAERLFVRAVELAEASGDHVLFAFSRIAQAELAVRRGDPDLAEQMVRQALPRLDAAASPHGLIEVHKLRGMIARCRGDLAAARAHLDAAAGLLEVHGVPLLQAEVHAERGVTLWVLGEHRGAVEDLTRAVETFATLNARHRAEEIRGILRGLAPASFSDTVRAA